MQYILFICGPEHPYNYSLSFRSRRAALEKAGRLRPGFYWDLRQGTDMYRDKEDRPVFPEGKSVEIASGGRPDLEGQ